MIGRVYGNEAGAEKYVIAGISGYFVNTTTASLGGNVQRQNVQKLYLAIRIISA
jgi:hypothetical protein